MEVNNLIIGTRLNEIHKTASEIKLVFENTQARKIYTLSFNGFLFETSNSALDRRVKSVQLTNTLGFRALSQLRSLKRKPENYKQLFIQMEGSDDEHKFELIGASRNIKVSNRKKVVKAKKTASPRISAPKE